MRKVFAIDLEGQITLDDNAFGLTKNKIDEGDKLFSQISKYDDCSHVIKKPIQSGNTLKLILPFLVAYGVSDENMIEYSSQNITLFPEAKNVLKSVRIPEYIVTTSYRHYVRPVCEQIDFPFERVYCTKFNINDYVISEKEKQDIRKLKEEIVGMPMIEIPKKVESLEDFSERDKRTINRLDEIFEEVIPRMSAGRILEEVKIMGSYEKARAVKDIVERKNTKLENVMFTGDSITDCGALRLVRENGGLAVSFNGNEYAINEASIAVLSRNTYPLLALADEFESGNKNVFKFIHYWNKIHGKSNISPRVLPKIEIITDENRERLAKESSVFRKYVRGEAIGRLG
jgi:energy-converting hydrogenase A subunit R